MEYYDMHLFQQAFSVLDKNEPDAMQQQAIHAE